jgi:predicted DNA-binding transcriptional regulator AlpA
MNSRRLNSTAVLAPPPSTGAVNPSTNPDETYLTSRAAANRYGVSVRSIDRWANRDGERSGGDAGGAHSSFPKPVMMSGRNYWRLSDLQAWERHCALKTASSRRRRGTETSSIITA